MLTQSGTAGSQGRGGDDGEATVAVGRSISVRRSLTRAGILTLCNSAWHKVAAPKVLLTDYMTTNGLISLGSFKHSFSTSSTSHLCLVLIKLSPLSHSFSSRCPLHTFTLVFLYHPLSDHCSIWVTASITSRSFLTTLDSNRHASLISRDYGERENINN